MIFALLHATLGWLLASLACMALRRRSAASRCWAWRLGLLKGPLALLLAVPVAMVQSPSVLANLPAREAGTSQRRLPLSARGERDKGEPSVPQGTLSPSVEPTSVTRLAPVPHDPIGSVRVDPFAVLYGLGVAAAIVSRLLAGRRVHAMMPRVEGVLRPRVVIPEGLAPEAAAMALAHESAHVRRRDPLWSLIADLTCAAFWFAPPVWLCARGLRAEAESACDAAALEATAASRKAYARLLLDFAGPAPANALGGPARRLARRILMLDTTVKPFSRSVVAVLFALGLLTLLPWRAVAVETTRSQEGPERGRLRGFGAGVPAVRLPLHVAVGLMLEEPGVRARIGWTAAQDAALKARGARWEAVVNAHRAEMVRLQATGPLKKFWDWEARERPAMFARADREAGPMPLTPKQERALRALALERFGSALWLDPQVANQLHLTPAQKAAVRKENSVIYHASIPTDARGFLRRPIPKKSKAVEARLKSLYAAYAIAPPQRRAALYVKIAKVERPYQPVYESQTPTDYKVRQDRRLAQSWRMRAEADRRLAAKLSVEQRVKLDELKRASEAWPVGVSETRRSGSIPNSSLFPRREVDGWLMNNRKATFSASWIQKKGSRITMSDDVLINGQKPGDMLPADGKGTLIDTIYLSDGSAWKVYAEGDKAPYPYRIERVPAPQKPASKSPVFLDYAGGKTTQALRQESGKIGAKTNVPPLPTTHPRTEESIRRSLRLQEVENLDFKPDLKHLGADVAEMRDREGAGTKYRIYRRPLADGAYRYEVVEAVYTVPAVKRNP